MTNARLTLIVLVTRSVVRIHVKSSAFNRHKVSVIYLVGRHVVLVLRLPRLSISGG